MSRNEVYEDKIKYYADVTLREERVSRNSEGRVLSKFRKVTLREERVSRNGGMVVGITVVGSRSARSV